MGEKRYEGQKPDSPPSAVRFFLFYDMKINEIISSIRGIVYISKIVISAIIRNKRFPKDWFKWRVETYYGIPSSEFTWKKLADVAKLSDIMKYSKWVDENRRILGKK